MAFWVRKKSNVTIDLGDDMGLPLHHVWPRSWFRYDSRTLQRLDDPTFTKLLQLIRRRIRTTGGSQSNADEVTRRLKKIRDPRFYVRVPTALITGSFRSSPVLDAIFPERRKNWIPPKYRSEETIISLKDFSFIDEPVETVKALRRIAEAEASVLQAQVDFLDEEMLDIGPYLLWGMMRQQMVPFMKGGKISDFAKQIIEAVDLSDFMGMNFLSTSQGVTDVWPFKLRQRGAAGTSLAPNLATAPTKKEKVADEFVATVNDWIGHLDPPLELTKLGRGNITKLVTEILDNAERHSRPEGDGHWAVAGFMSRRNEEQNDPRLAGEFICCVAFLSVGSTIAETISASEDADTKAGLTKYLSLHRGGLMSRGVDPEILKTVFALKDGASRISQEPGAPKGGVGMMEVADMAVELSHRNGAMPSARVAILSGNTCVTFKDHYVKGLEDPTTQLRLQWFNPSNSIAHPPDPTYAAALPFRIPGTIIAVRFSLDRSYTEPSE